MKTRRSERRSLRHHLDPFIPEFSASIGPPDAIAVDMRQLYFDRIGVPEAAFVQEGRKPPSGSRGWSFPLS